MSNQVSELTTLLNGIDQWLLFGEPWQLKETSLTAVIPLLTSDPMNHQRMYRLIQEDEIKDKVTFKDTGSISKATVKNSSDKPVFIRKGVILEGGGTQERTVAVGTVAEPEEEKIVNIQCIHASKGIRMGASFNVAQRLVPSNIEETLLHRSGQGEVWGQASAYVSSVMSARTSPLRSESAPRPRVHRVGGIPQGTFSADSAAISRDDLAGTLRETSEFRDDIDKVMEKIPADLQNQVGIALIDGGGVKGVEFFDHPDSWKAYSKSIVRNYAETIAAEKENPDPLFKLNSAQIAPAIKKFLGKLRGASEEVVDKTKSSKTMALLGEGLVGEYTAMYSDGETAQTLIHLIASRSDRKKKTEPRQNMIQAQAGNFVLSDSAISSIVRDTVDETVRNIGRDNTIREDRNLRGRGNSWKKLNILGSEEFLGVPMIAPLSNQPVTPQPYTFDKGVKEILNTLDNKPQTWSELFRKANLAPATLSKRLRELTENSITSRKADDDGKIRYDLTSRGKHLNQYVKSFQ